MKLSVTLKINLLIKVTIAEMDELDIALASGIAILEMQDKSGNSQRKNITSYLRSLRPFCWKPFNMWRK
jgi:hypothetical protein